MNVNKFSPQKLAQIETQEIQSLLQAGREFGTNKLLINVNGQESKIKTNKNGIIKYTLEQPHKLNIGDQVTLIDSFIEERGLNDQTIQFEKDVEEEMRFLYYIQGDLRNSQTGLGDVPYDAYCADMEYAHFPSFFPDGSYGENVDGKDPLLNFFDPSQLALLKMNAKNIPMFPTWNFRDDPMGCGNELTYESVGGSAPFVAIKNFGTCTNGLSCGKDKDTSQTKVNVSTGATGQYYYMMEFFSPAPLKESGNKYSLPDNDFREDVSNVRAHKLFFRPLYGATVIKVPAGNYSVSALSDLINNQLNGSIADARKTFENRLTNRLYDRTDEISFEVTVPPFSGLFGSTHDTTNTSASNALYNPDSLIIGEDTFQPFQRRRGDVVTQFYFNSDMTGNRVNLQTMRFLTATPNSNAKWNNGQSLHVWNTMNEFAGENPEDFHLSSPCEALSYVKDPIYSDRFKDARQYNGNFYIHLAGLRHLFENENKQYWNQSDDNELEIIENFNPSDFPSLADLFLCNVGLNGLKYFDQDPNKFNHGGYDVSLLDPDDYPWFYSDQPDEYIFSCMFGVSGSGDHNRPLWEASGDTPHDSSKVPAPELCLPVQKPLVQQFAGTTAIEVDFDLGKSNRFIISNLHEPYKLQNNTSTLTGSTGMGGQEATSMNYPAFFDFREVDDGGNQQDQINGPANPPCGIYPIESVSGIAVNNFSFSTVKNTTVYKELVAKIAEYNVKDNAKQMYREKLIFDLFTKPYDQFFGSEDEAKSAWSESLWNRIGFDYEQIGSISDKLESVYSFSNPSNFRYPVNTAVDKVNKVKQMGIITHNAFDNSFIPSSSGLGIANPYNKSAQTGKVANPQTYGLRSAGCGVNETQTNQVGFAQNRINILANTQPIIADSFPALNAGNNYLLIESDIVKPNAKDSKSNETTIVGIVSKENSSNDTLFHNTPIPFTITEPKLLSTIEVRIKNPDGTLVSDDIVGKNNGFIFQVEKAIQPSAMTMESF
tara:strand:+ start:11472 stop:14453 length:2982 start_codon:yes stop_codon:yes gene_type:complete